MLLDKVAIKSVSEVDDKLVAALSKLATLRKVHISLHKQASSS